MDMLRYDRFTGGRFWVSEYGSASNPEQFPFLIRYSPVQNIKPGTCYPATLVTTADHDDRVGPEPLVQVRGGAAGGAGLRQAGADPRGGGSGSHGYRPTDKLIAERADQWAFAAEAMKIER